MSESLSEKQLSQLDELTLATDYSALEVMEQIGVLDDRCLDQLTATEAQAAIAWLLTLPRLK